MLLYIFALMNIVDVNCIYVCMYMYVGIYGMVALWLASELVCYIIFATVFCVAEANPFGPDMHHLSVNRP